MVSFTFRSPILLSWSIQKTLKSQIHPTADEKEVHREAEIRAQAQAQREEFLQKLTDEERQELSVLIKKATQK